MYNCYVFNLTVYYVKFILKRRYIKSIIIVFFSFYNQIFFSAVRTKSKALYLWFKVRTKFSSASLCKEI